MSVNEAGQAEVDRIVLEIEQAGQANPLAQIEKAERSLSLAMAIDYWIGQSKSNYFLAQAYARQKNLADAIIFAQRALEIAQTHQLAAEETAALIILAGAYSTVGMTAEALELLLNNHIAEKAQHDTVVLERYLNTLGVCYLNMGDYVNALSTFNQILELARAHGRSDSEWVALANIGSVYSIQRQHDSTLAAFRQALAVGEAQQSVSKQVYALTTLAGVETDLLHFPEAVELLARAETLLGEHEATANPSFLRTTAHLHYMRGDAAQAVPFFEQALQLVRVQNDWYMTRFILQELSEIYKAQGDYRKSLELAEELYQATLKTNDEQTQTRIQALQVAHNVELLRLRSEAAERELVAYKQAEQERLEKERLQLIYGQEQAFAQQKSRVLNRLHHELRTPLTIIASSVYLVTRYAQRLSDEKLEGYRATIEEQNTRIHSIMQDIGTVLHSREQQQLMPAVNVPLLEFCSAAVKKAYTQTQTSDRIRLSVPDQVSEVSIDESMLTYILVELLTNGLKFSTDLVFLTVKSAPESLTIQVEDSGIGIPLQEQGKIFDPLFRASNSEDVSGTGLGLTIVRDYVRHLGGEIQISSALDAGCTVTVTMPVMTSTEQDNDNHASTV